MGQKDITEKMLADYNDVFADIVNVLLFNGKQVVSPDDLVNTKDKSQYRSLDSGIHEMERDVTKIVQSKKVKIALVGLEHQTNVDETEPVRVIGYDGSSYRSQLLNNNKDVYPVVTMVLYFGLTRWDKPLTLWEQVHVSDEWKPYVNDYKVNLFEIAFLEPEQVEMFQSDFRIVADYFVQMRINKDYSPSKETIQHVDEVLKLMSVLLEDERFEMVQNEGIGGVKNMCEVLDRVENKGIMKGKIEGKIEILQELGYNSEEIAQKLNISTDEVNSIIVSFTD